jgi:hypothetical protein
MKVHIQTWCVPKAGSSEDEYEDAFSPDSRNGLEQDCTYLHVAIADGATETSFSREWADVLAATYTRRPVAFYVQSSLEKLGRDMSACANARVERAVSSRGVPWYAEQKAREGAFAAVLGVSLWSDRAGAIGHGKWRAWAVGDCCVFQIRGDELLARFPLGASTDFNNRPFLLSTRAERNGAWVDHALSHRGHWTQGDEFLLMSDAMACWFLRQWERHGDPFTERLARIRDNSEFAEFVARERHDCVDGAPLMPNDDVTLTRCQILGS